MSVCTREFAPCVVAEHLVFAAMSNWPGCSGFAEISPVDQGMVRWGDFPAAATAAAICAGSVRATRDTAVAPLRSSSALRLHTARIEPSLSQVIGRMNREIDLSMWHYAPRRRWRTRARPRLTGYRLRVTELQNAVTESPSSEKRKRHSWETATDILCISRIPVNSFSCLEFIFFVGKSEMSTALEY